MHDICSSAIKQAVPPADVAPVTLIMAIVKRVLKNQRSHHKNHQDVLYQSGSY
jgi:hypothetical protein